MVKNVPNIRRFSDDPHDSLIQKTALRAEPNIQKKLSKAQKVCLLKSKPINGFPSPSPGIFARKRNHHRGAVQTFTESDPPINRSLFREVMPPSLRHKHLPIFITVAATHLFTPCNPLKQKAKKCNYSPVDMASSCGRLPLCWTATITTSMGHVSCWW